MENNPLLELHNFGQSIWLDFIRRGMLDSGELQDLIRMDGLRGVTSNPAIFEKAIDGSADYDEAIRTLALEGKSAAQIYDTLTVTDVQHAADVFAPVYQRTDGRDGYVSLEVSPHLAHDAAGTVAEARRLWRAVDRSNVMIKVPATREGLAAIQQLISEGINVNVTLLFGLSRYREVIAAYTAGMEARDAGGQPLGMVASVASFFLSRIDVLVDPLLEQLMKGDDRNPTAALARRLHGQTAIASAKKAYQIYQKAIATDHYCQLANKGAHPQRLLWASTSTKNPDYSDVKYVEALIGPDTVNTLPLETLNAYRDHGRPAYRLDSNVDQATVVLDGLADLGIDLDEVADQLEAEGVQKFIRPFDRLMETLERKRQAALTRPVDRQTLNLAGFGTAISERIASLESQNTIPRLWRKDASLWKEDADAQAIITNALGWLHVAEKMEAHLSNLAYFAAQVKADRFRNVVHIGMGGSSLAPLVFQRTFQPAWNALPLTVLDTTDPVTILGLERKLTMADTLFIVASKSGTTAETLALGDYFYEKLKRLKGEQAGENFIAITDPETSLDQLAQERGFRHIFRNFKDIGGRYSALTYFGLVPAALMGVDVGEIVARALRMAHACAASVPGEQNPGLILGAALGELALQGRDKVTFIMPKSIATLGMWLEQLLAESTGKEGTGLIPIAGEPVGDPAVYGQDRFFIYFKLAGETDADLEKGVTALRAAGQPVATIQLVDPLDLGQEFMRWEVATAVAGAILHINAFDQPNVQESKDNTNRLLNEVRRGGHLQQENPAIKTQHLQLFAQERKSETLSGSLDDFFNEASPNDYAAIMAYLPENSKTDAALNTIRLRLRSRSSLATTVGYGPRFLHSTGQLHKGGPNTGLFLQLTADDQGDTPVPHQPYTFSVFKQAQAQGDLHALRQHGRRVVRLDLGDDVDEGLAELSEALGK
ncbi:MAG: bifunctional transaldolase/phosoglucose isomerase [Chloroflexota bacterium]|jgi:transaldolase/glucose-6-phosphate isomerase